ncbi:uncharacterized protein [Rhodnius prolixus]|uniref:uncharacterized protein n=1 Tax=Rhodnius prolixus TaxID=13249 RepID=UPI003D18FAE2
MWRSLLIHSIVIMALIIEGISRSEFAVKDPIFIEINPNIFRSKNVTKFDAKNKRLKRGKFEEKPSLLLQFSPSFFTSPQLHDLYAAITGISDKIQTDSFNKNDQPFREETKIVFQINPYMIPGVNLKRQISNENMDDDLVAFSLTINPQLPRKVPKLRNFINNCVDRPAEEVWCLSHKDYSKCPASATYPTTTAKCMPVMPNKSDMMCPCCTLNWYNHFGSKDPCDECARVSSKPATMYTACKSSPPPTVMPTLCSAETVTCRHITRTDLTPPYILTAPPMITQKCDTCIKDKSNLIEDKLDKYFILVKRSPRGTWSRTLRKKRGNLNKHFKFYLVPITKKTGTFDAKIK